MISASGFCYLQLAAISRAVFHRVNSHTAAIVWRFRPAFPAVSQQPYACVCVAIGSVMSRVVAVIAGAEQTQFVGGDRHHHRRRRVLEAAEEEPRHALVGRQEHFLIVLPHLVPEDREEDTIDFKHDRRARNYILKQLLAY